MVTIKTDKANVVKWVGILVAAVVAAASVKYPDHSQALWDVAVLLGGVFGLTIVKPETK